MKIMRTLKILFIFALLGQSPAGAQAPLTVTYIANEGFLIESAGKKILIDALFGGWQSDWCDVPSDSLLQLITSAHPPFDNIDLIVVTHAHSDHFNADITAAHLKHNSRGILVCTPRAAELLAATEPYADIRERIRVVNAPGDSAVSMEISEIGLRVLPTGHGAYWETDPASGTAVDRHRHVQHLEFVVTIGEHVLFHCGDASMIDEGIYRSMGLGEKPINLAFIQWWSPQEERMSARQVLVHDLIRPERIILMHLTPSEKLIDQSRQKEPVSGELIVPQYSLQSWTFP